MTDYADGVGFTPEPKEAAKMGDNIVGGPRQQRMLISRRGGPEVLTLMDEPMPQPGPNQLRLRVVATGVAFADVLVREGLYQGIPSYPFAPGYEHSRRD